MNATYHDCARGPAELFNPDLLTAWGHDARTCLGAQRGQACAFGIWPMVVRRVARVSHVRDRRVVPVGLTSAFVTMAPPLPPNTVCKRACCRFDRGGDRKPLEKK